MSENRYLKSPQDARESVDDLTKAEARTHATELRDAIAELNRAYYVEGRSKVSDSTYDNLFARLQEIESQFPELDDPASPTRRVGVAPVDSLENVEHSAPMLSLEAVLDDDEAREHFGRLEREAADAGEQSPRFVAEPKIDGLSLEVQYENGRLVRAATRGDGQRGDDVTANARTIRSLPLRLSEAPDRLSVRGEVVLRRDEFISVNERRSTSGDEPFANPRNAAAGTLRLLDSSKVASVPLDCIVYDILDTSDPLESHEEELRLLETIGFLVSELNTTITSFDEVSAFRDRLLERRDEYDVEMDGVVIKLDDLAARERLGVRDRSPRWALAWKFEPREKRTRVRKIVTSVGRTGRLTPLGLLDPVEIGGVTVSRVSLHNADEVERLDVREGDLIRIERAGDVIPHVAERIEEETGGRGPRFAMPDRCPACGAEVVHEGAYHRCTNGLQCPAQLVGTIEHYGSREALDIGGLGEKTARLLVDEGLVGSLADIYALDRSDLEELEGFGEKSAAQLQESIQSSKNPQLGRFLYALGIPGVGRHLARELALDFGDLRSLTEADIDRLAATGEIGERTGRDIHMFFADEQTASVVDALLDHGVRPVPPEQSSQTLDGLTIVITGSLESFTRDEAKAAIEERGGRATSSVSGQTDILVAGQDPGSKLSDATEHGVRVIDEEVFQRLLAGE